MKKINDNKLGMVSGGNTPPTFDTGDRPLSPEEELRRRLERDRLFRERYGRIRG